MGNIFSYDSKVMRTLMYVGDMIILNILFLICSIPIITIGAAQTGLYTGIRVLQDPEDDSSPAGAFIRGFIGGFGKITLIWTLFLVIFIFLILSLVPAIAKEAPATAALAQYAQIPNVHPLISTVALALCALICNMLIMFHTRFNCSLTQLFRNSVLMNLAHPIRSIFATALVWVPVFVLLGNFYMFMQITPVFAAFGFCGLSHLSFGLLNKPFKELIQREKAREAEASGEALPEETLEQIPDEAEETV